MNSPTLSFKPRARLIRTIGDRLISGPETAVIELVKNSHDADANYVKITIEPTLTNVDGEIVAKGCITIKDDGHGMSFDDIEQKWMEPATTDKRDRRTSPKGRPLLGSKGIGRFASARLGHVLKLSSTAIFPEGSGIFQTTTIPKIDWNLFDQVEYLSEIEFNYDCLEEGDQTETTLVITALRETWTETSLQDLQKELRRLISPLEETDKSHFRIYLDLSAFTVPDNGFDGAEIVNGALPDKEQEKDPNRIKPFPLLNSCDYEISGEFNNNGFFSGSLTIHRGGLEPEEIKFAVPVEEGEENCGLVLVHLFIFDRETDALKNTMKRAGLGDVTVKQARALVDDLSGVAIYRDKFRIRPYGNSDNDWLTMDMRRVQNPSMRMGHNQVSGILVISDEHSSDLVEKSSREGLEENGSYRRLQRLMHTLFIDELEPKRFAFREKAEIERNKSNVLNKALVAAEFKWAQQYLSSLPDKVRAEAEAKFAKESKALHRYLKQLEATQAKLEAQVTLGLIIGEVMHESSGPVAYIFDQSRRLSKWWKIIFDETKEAEKAKSEIPGVLRRVTLNSQKLIDLLRALKPLAGGKRSQAIYYSPNQVIIDTNGLFRSSKEEIGVEESHKDSTGGKDILGYREDLTTAVTNIFDNALFWFEHHKTKNPMLSVTVDSDEKKNCIIRISDNGAGIPYEFHDVIFDVGFSLKPNGTGLGLSIAQEAISRSKGTITLDETDKGTGFTIQIPYGE
jgi:signal transduction histidine kinase